jgi:hypothetical protein
MIVGFFQQKGAGMSVADELTEGPRPKKRKVAKKVKKAKKAQKSGKKKFGAGTGGRGLTLGIPSKKPCVSQGQ